jgi:RsiW-degrading membrane proteinase PrsW (M82 family)
MTVAAGGEIVLNLLMGIVPPFLATLWYACQLKSAPDRRVLLGLFILGGIAGYGAAAMQRLFFWGARQIPGWELFANTIFGKILHQFGVTALTEELCKLIAVVLVLWWVMVRSGRMPAQPGTVLIAAMTVGFGLAAQENAVYLLEGRATVVDRLLSLPGHGVFAAPWGLTLGFAVCRVGRHLRYSVDLVLKGWLVSVLCHGLANSIALLSTVRGWGNIMYLFFPWLLYLLWLTQGIVARAQGEVLPGRAWGDTLPERLKYLGFGAATLWLGGLAIIHLRLLGNSVIDPFRYAGMLSSNPNFNYFLVNQLFRVVILGTAAILVFRYQILRQDEL